MSDTLTLSEAAALAGREYGWARERRIDGRLECAPGNQRPFRVTTDSLHRLIESEGRCVPAYEGVRYRLNNGQQVGPLLCSADRPRLRFSAEIENGNGGGLWLVEWDKDGRAISPAMQDYDLREEIL